MILSKDFFLKNDPDASPLVSGMKHRRIRMLIWGHIFYLALVHWKNPLSAFRRTRDLLRFRNKFRSGHSLRKYAQTENQYFFTYNAPGWPSKAFDRYILHQLRNLDHSRQNTSIHTVLFGITKKCGFQCEHCCEWENLNRPEKLSRNDLAEIVLRFQTIGVTQIQLSGGEPLNRLEDILYLLKQAKKGTEFWLLTSGYSLDEEKARTLKTSGLTGITISLDHCLPELHDRFRGRPGSFDRVFKAAAHARSAGLSLCFSLCPTNEFINQENLSAYFTLAKNAGASFIQILEPRAVGHYQGKEVALEKKKIQLLERFYEKMNYSPAGNGYPIISYHGYYSRRTGCAGAGKDYVYVDTDGDVHSCPFCRTKLFSSNNDQLQKNLSLLKATGCAAFDNCSTSVQLLSTKNSNAYESL